MQKPTTLYTIGQISKMCNISIQTLRYYDREGLLKPEVRDTDNNYRLYSREQLMQLLIIKELKCLGFPLCTIKDFVKQKDLLRLKNEFETKKKEIKSNIQNLQMQLLVAINQANLIMNGLKVLGSENQINSDNKARYNVELKMIPEFAVVYTRYQSRCNAKELFIERYVELQSIKEQYQLFACEPFIAVFHNHYTHQFFFNEADLEVCLPLVESRESCPAVKSLGGFLAAATIHIGSYMDGIAGYLALAEWIENNGFEVAGPAMEEYVIGPNNTDYELNYVTKITLPVKKTDE